MHTKLALVGILAALGAASGASAFCPPDEGCSGEAVVEVRGIPMTARTVEGQPLRLHTTKKARKVKGHQARAIEVQGQPMEVFTVQGHPAEAIEVQGHPIEAITVQGHPAGAIEVMGQPVKVRTVKGRRPGAIEVQGQPLEIHTVEGHPGAIELRGHKLRLHSADAQPGTVELNLQLDDEDADGAREVHGVQLITPGMMLDEKDGSGQLIEMRIPTMQLREDGAQLVEVPLHAVAAQPEPKAARARVVTRARPGADAKGDSNVVVVQNGQTISLKMDNGQVASLQINGKDVPSDRVRKEGNAVIVTDEDGKVLQRFSVGEGADTFEVVKGMPASRDLFVAAEPPSAMIGVQLGEPDALLLGHFGLEAGEVTLVTGVYKDLPAAKAGIHPYDIIVSVNGKKPAGPAELREALRSMSDGDKVSFRVIHRGEEKDLKVELVKYDQEALEKSELDAVETNVMGFAVGQGGDNVFVAPGLGALSPGMDQDKVREFAERWRQEAEKLGERFKATNGDAPGMYWTTPGAPTPPPAPAPKAATEERWQRLEDRLQRLEKMLERLAETKPGR